MTAIRQPFGGAQVLEPSFASPLDISSADNDMLIVAPSSNVSSNFTLNINNITNEIPDGAHFTLIVTDGGGANTITFGTNIEGTSIALGAGEKRAITAILYGGTYRVTGSYQLA